MKFVSLLVRSALVSAMLLAVGIPVARAQTFDVGNSAALNDDDGSNQAPTIDNVQLPSLVRTNDVVEVTFDASDLDGDALVPSYEWRKNGIVIAGETGATLDLSRPGYGDRGDIISVVVSVSDGLGGTTTAPEVPVTVENTLPSIASVNINNLTPKTNDTLSAQCNASDADGDALTTTYQWKKNGVVIVGATGATLDLSRTGNGNKGDVISVVAIIADGEGATSLESSPVTIQNSAPEEWDRPLWTTWMGRSLIGRPAITDADADPLRFSAVGLPTSGTLGGLDATDGLFLFSPAKVGKALISLRVSDGEATKPIAVEVDVSAAPASGTKIYTALGDSTALAIGASTFSQGYSARIERALQSAEGPGGSGWQLSVRGIRNFTAPDLLRKVGGQSLLSLAIADKPSVVTVWIGLNDTNSIAGYRTPPETLDGFSTAFGTVIKTLASYTKARVVVADVPNLAQLPYANGASTSMRLALSRASIELQKRINTAMQGVRTGFARVVLLNDPATRANFCASDGFHPNSNGHNLVAMKMFAALLHGLEMEFPPVIAAASPNNSQDLVGKRRTFQLVVSDANGAATLSQVELLLDSRLDAGTGAYLLYSPQTRQLSLRLGRTWLGPIRTGTRANPNEVLDNGTVRIVGRDVATTLSSDGTTLSLSLPMTIGIKLVGKNVVFVRVKDNTGRTPAQALPSDMGYVRAGNYTVLPVPIR
ncbi:hypothetical protein IAD21_00455 [Abditibacteriota bacterium]|nr:hypothetical protein IAD21_00455 [Abditibacteriota bacterium]